MGRTISRLDGRLFGCIYSVVKGIVFASRLHSTTHKFSRRGLSRTKDEGCAIYAVARCSLFDDWRRYLPLTFYLVVFFKKLTANQETTQALSLFMCPTFVWLGKKLSLLSKLVFKFIVSSFVKKVFWISVLPHS